MNLTVKDLLDAGVHFGHQTRRWNPKSRPYVFDHRNGVSIIDLEKTHACLAKAVEAVETIVASGKDVLFVSTKPQAQEIVREAAKSTAMPRPAVTRSLRSFIDAYRPPCALVVNLTLDANLDLGGTEVRFRPISRLSAELSAAGFGAAS